MNGNLPGISEMKLVTEVGKIFQAEGTYKQRLREKFSKENIQKYTKYTK